MPQSGVLKSAGIKPQPADRMNNRDTPCSRASGCEARTVAQTQTEARQFFVDKVIEQADSDGTTLSKDERQMLFWSESEPDPVADLDLAGRLAGEISDSDYEAEIVGLLQRSFARDIARDPRARDRWRQAWSVLEEGDHYILIMINAAVGRQLKPWWRVR